MTTDIFIAGLIGMTLIALVVAALTYRRDSCERQDRQSSDPSSLPEEQRD